MPFGKITIVGVGLLGGSVGLAVRQRGLANEVAGYVRRETSLADCERFGAVDYATTDLLAAVSGADLILLCTPLAQMREIVRQMSPALKQRSIVTDVGSVKASVVRELESLVHKQKAHFIGSHPMAGAEKSGVQAARATLFENAACVVTPTTKSDGSALRKVERFWKELGAHVLRLPAEVHDRLVSRSSHLPHVVAAALANLILDPKRPRQAELCATGFRDTTRIASGSPDMWRDIAVANRRNLSQALGALIGDLKKLQQAVKKGDAERIMRFLQQAKMRRDAWCSRCASPSPE